MDCWLDTGGHSGVEAGIGGGPACHQETHTQAVFAVRDRAACEHVASSGPPTRSHGNIRELWVPLDFQGSLPEPLITGILPHLCPSSHDEIDGVCLQLAHATVPESSMAPHGL